MYAVLSWACGVRARNARFSSLIVWFLQSIAHTNIVNPQQLLLFILMILCVCERDRKQQTVTINISYV